VVARHLPQMEIPMYSGTRLAPGACRITAVGSL